MLNMKKNIIKNAMKHLLIRAEERIFFAIEPLWEMLVATFWMPPMDMMLCGWQQELLMPNLKGNKVP
jgi:hypothetical protein